MERWSLRGLPAGAALPNGEAAERVFPRGSYAFRSMEAEIDDEVAVVLAKHRARAALAIVVELWRFGH